MLDRIWCTFFFLTCVFIWPKMDHLPPHVYTRPVMGYVFWVVLVVVPMMNLHKIYQSQSHRPPHPQYWYFVSIGSDYSTNHRRGTIPWKFTKKHSSHSSKMCVSKMIHHQYSIEVSHRKINEPVDRRRWGSCSIKNQWTNIPLERRTNHHHPWFSDLMNSFITHNWTDQKR